MQKDKYRVCIVTAILPPAYGGAEVAAFGYAKRLNHYPDSSVMVIGWDRNGAYADSGRKNEFVHSVSLYEDPEDAKGILIYLQQYVHMARCFAALWKPMWKHRDKYDIIHNFNSGFAFNRVAILISKLLGKKSVTETSLIGDDDPISLGRFTGWKDYLKPKFFRYLFYKMADAFVSKSPVMTEIFKQSEIDISKVYEIPYPVDTNLFSPVSREEKAELRKKLGMWNDGIIILFVGGITERKGVHILVDAFCDLSESREDLRLVLAGPTYKYDQEYITALKQKISRSELSDRVMFTDNNVENVDEYMKSSDIFVLPSRKEGFPISVIEAMSTGLAVIGSDIPEIAKAQISNKRDGCVFSVGDKSHLITTLEYVLSCNGKAQEFGKEAREKALNNWSTEIVDAAYKDMYSRILN